MHEYIARWKAEEKIAHIRGWDFSHIHGRYEEEQSLPWDYREEILCRLNPSMRILDVDTGGGEFLLSLKHPHHLCAAAENFPPNAALCRDTLLPLGVDFKQADGKGPFPWADHTFDMVINRHGDLCPGEIFRVLKPGGYFITQQVGACNDRELVQLLLGDTPLPFPDQHLAIIRKQFEESGFRIEQGMEAFGAIRFFDVGALVWFARIIEWEFPDFSVDTHLENLLRAQAQLERDGCLSGRTHRFLLIAQKT